MLYCYRQAKYWSTNEERTGLAMARPPTAAELDRDAEQLRLLLACRNNPTDEAVYLQFKQACLPIITGATSKYRSRFDDEAFSDFLQEAEIGLIQAMSRFDERGTVPFGAFARRRVNGAVIDHARKASKSGQLQSRNAYCEWRALEEAIDAFASVRGYTPQNDDELAEFLGCDAVLLRWTRSHCAPCAVESFEANPGIEETIAEQDGAGAANPAERLIQELGGAGPSPAELVEAISSLPDRERFVIVQYFQAERTTLRVIAALFDPPVSEGRACQIKTQALVRLREKLGIEPPEQEPDEIAEDSLRERSPGEKLVDVLKRKLEKIGWVSTRSRSPARQARQSHHENGTNGAGRSNGMSERTEPGLLPVASADGRADAVRLTPGIFRIAVQMWLRIPAIGRSQPDRDGIVSATGTTRGSLQISMDQLAKAHIIDRPERGWFARGAQVLVYCREGKNREERGEVSLVPREPTGFRFQTDRYYDLAQIAQLLPSPNGRSHGGGQPAPPSQQPPRTVVRVEILPPILQLPAPPAEPNGFANLDKGITDREGWLAAMKDYLERIPDARTTLDQLEEQIRAGMERQRSQIVTLNAAREIRNGNAEIQQPTEAT